MRAGLTQAIQQIDDATRFVSFTCYDLAYIDLEHRTLQRATRPCDKTLRQPVRHEVVTHVLGTIRYPCLRVVHGRIGAGEGNRTPVFSLEGCCSTIELHPRRRVAGSRHRIEVARSVIVIAHLYRKLDGGGSRTRTYEGIRQLIYSQPPLPLGTFPRRAPHLGGASVGALMESARVGVNPLRWPCVDFSGDGPAPPGCAGRLPFPACAGTACDARPPGP